MGQVRQHVTYLCLQERSPMLSHTEHNPPKLMTPLSELRVFLPSSAVHQLCSVGEGKSLESSGIVLASGFTLSLLCGLPSHPPERLSFTPFWNSHWPSGKEIFGPSPEVTPPLANNLHNLIPVTALLALSH